MTNGGERKKGMYEHYRAVREPSVFRTFSEAIAQQRKQLIMLATLFVFGLVVSFVYSSFVGGIIMTGSGVSLLGTVVAGKYQD